MSSNKPNPLPLGEVLRDLAVLRASDVDLSDGTTFPDAESTDSANEADGTQKSVQQSYQFVKEAREVLKVHQRGDLDKQVDKLGVLRSKLEELRGGTRDDNNQRLVFWFRQGVHMLGWLTCCGISTGCTQRRLDGIRKRDVIAITNPFVINKECSGVLPLRRLIGSVPRVR